MHLESFTEHNLAAVMSCLVIRRGEKTYYNHQIFPVISGSLYYKKSLVEDNFTSISVFKWLSLLSVFENITVYELLGKVQVNPN